MARGRGRAQLRRTIPGTGARDKGKLWWLIAAGAIVLAAMNPFVAVLVLVGMAPAIVAGVTSEQGGASRARCIGYFGMSGVFPMAWSLWQATPSSATLTLYLSDPLVWLAMYAPAAIGGLIYLTVPALHEAMFIRRLQHRRELILAMQRQLVEEWGPQVDPAQEEPQSLSTTARLN